MGGDRRGGRKEREILWYIIIDGCINIPSNLYHWIIRCIMRHSQQSALWMLPINIFKKHTNHHVPKLLFVVKLVLLALSDLFSRVSSSLK